MQFRAVGASEDKSLQDKEKANQEEHEAAAAAAEKADDSSNNSNSSLSDESVLNYLKEKHGKEFESLEDAFKPIEKEVIKEVVKEVDLPEDIKSLMEYRKTTGRGIEDYLALNKDWENTDEQTRLREFYRQTNPHLSEEDIDFEVGEMFKEEDDFNTEADYRKSVINRKQKVLEATNFLNERKSMYKEPVKSTGSELGDDLKQKIEAFESYQKELEAQQQQNEKRSAVFREKTEKLFGEGFKGFEYKVGDDKNVLFTPGDAEEVKKAQSSPFNFVSKYVNKETGVIEDAVGYHKALAAAMDPEGFAKHFFEAGRAAQAEELEKGTKNVDIRMRGTHSSFQTQKSGFRSVSSHGDNSKVKVRTRN